MATFVYEAMNSVGQPVKGEVEATNSEEAIARIRQKGEFPTEVKAKAGRRAPRGGPSDRAPRRSIRSIGRIPGKLLVQFTRQLSTLIDAGLPVLRVILLSFSQSAPASRPLLAHTFPLLFLQNPAAISLNLHPPPTRSETLLD